MDNVGKQVKDLADELDTMSGVFENDNHDTYAS